MRRWQACEGKCRFVRRWQACEAKCRLVRGGRLVRMKACGWMAGL